MKLIVFLGNPGVEYKKTRHNAGWMVADRIGENHGVAWQEKFSGEFATAVIGGRKVLLLRPTTFMNRSGLSVQKALAFFKLDREDCCVVHDDLELPFGRVETKKGGGLAGHNGLRSVAQSLGTEGFYRLRVGIGRPAKGSVHNHVLGRFSPEEEAELPALLDRAVELIEEFIEK